MPDLISDATINPLHALALDPQAAAERLAALQAVAGVQVAGVTGGDLRLGAAGLADAETGTPVDTSTRFRIGSMTKLLTAELVVRCVTAGLLSMDDPLSKFLPGPWQGVLVRHLLSHSSGLDAADAFVDMGTGPDAIARYTDMLHGVGSLFAPGTMFSYCNADFILAGRLAEIVLGQPWRAALHAHLLAGSGMRDTDFVDGQAAEHDLRTARGHVMRDGRLTALPRRLDNPMCTQGLDPAGASTVSTAADLARFTVAHLASPDTEIMRTLHAPAPGGVATMLGAGFGWMVWANATGTSVRIGGANPGQSGLIAADPATNTVAVVLTNSDQGINAINAALDGAGPASDGRPEGEPADVTAYAGRYTSHAVTIEITSADDGLRARAEGYPETPLTRRDRQTFDSPVGPVAFLDVDDQGAPRYLRWRMRVMRRLDTHAA